MVLEWREREHEEVDVVVERDLRGPNGLENMWVVQILGTQRDEGPGEVVTVAHELLGSRK
jgi:hypothetical protein